MVMKRNMMRWNLYQSIVHSLGRYVAIAVIIALGAGMFVGLRSTRYDMVATGQKYMDQQNMFDIRLLTSYGWETDQLDEIRKLDGIVDAEGIFYTDLIVERDEAGADSVYRFYSMPETINQLVLLGGRMPEKTDECLADGFRNGDSILGSQITISDVNEEDSLDLLKCKSFTVVGYVSTPLYMDMNRGNTSVGNGSISNYFFLPREAFDNDYYTEIHLTIPGEYDIYTDSYNDALSEFSDRIEPDLKPLADKRLNAVREDALAKYHDGLKEYHDGLREFLDSKRDAENGFFYGFKSILDGEETLRHSEEKLIKGEKDIASGKYKLYEAKQELDSAKRKLKKTKASTYETIESANKKLTAQYNETKENLTPIEAGLTEINNGLAPLDGAISTINSNLSALKSQSSNLKAAIASANATINANQAALDHAEENELSEERIDALRAEINACKNAIEGYSAQRTEISSQIDALQGQLDELNATRAPLAAQKDELLSAKNTVMAGLSQIEAGLSQLKAQKSKADQEFAAAEAKIKEGLEQIQEGYDELAWQERKIKEGWEDLKQGKIDWREGYHDYVQEKVKAKKELDDAERELLDADVELSDAKEKIDGMTKNEVIILDRNSNLGYNSLDSSSNIVAGVSKVFPAFFLLVASLVCITTMTRMVDDERTQIGTLKALGYSNWAIISKYLFYAGSSALIGCTTGVILGSIAFPIILWEAYKIMLFVTPRISLCINWSLCLSVVFTYCAVMLGVTWYCCRKELKEVPAELIRPKAPSAGKQLIFENLKVWNKLSFLNKVAVRNIFRYRQRLAMMLLGIGGCTGLLLTGFGLRDSIMNIVNIQFEEVTRYDIETYFRSGRTEEEQEKFLGKLNPYVDGVLFYYQTSVDLDTAERTKDISLIVAPEEITEYIDFHKGNKQVLYPDTDEILLSSGMADMLDLKVGDQITLRSMDLETMAATISGIYDNHVYNYAIMSPYTMEKQWGRIPENQMAYVKVRQGQDSYSVGAVINGLDGVMNVTVNEELANMVNKMMEALNLVVLVVVFCAGLLAAIVLYNLTNINITERIREIATIKVLGFNALETAMYVFKENLVLSVMGSAFGMVLGELLLRFVISQIKIDMIWLEARLSTLSYVLSIVLTLIMGILVDLVFYFRLEKINMAEALKSVE